ncbi:MAG TPA: hypothetical protein VN372_01805 [Methanospirillum sp.]|nr:hypothetical protein [Methanospirillum sp.]
MSDGENAGSLSEGRIVRLEYRVTELDALVKGLRDEILDMKSDLIKMKKEQRPAPVIQASSPPPVSRNKPFRHDDGDIGSKGAPADIPVVTEHVKKEKVTYKMQPDGTLAPVKDTGEDIIIATAHPKGKDKVDRQNRSELIIAEDQEPTDRK